MIQLPNGTWVSPLEITSIEAGLDEVVITMLSDKDFRIECDDPEKTRDEIAGAVNRHLESL